MQKSAQLDCEQGRKSGCQTFCCRLLVRRDAPANNSGGDCGTSSRFIDKGKDGYCVYLNRDTKLCRIWEQRPSVCQGYDCNFDFLLQVALRHTFRNAVELARIAATTYIAKDRYFRIPYTADQD